MIKRFRRGCLYILSAVLFGSLYGLFVNHTGFGIPCPFHRLTGLLCPGCGVTKMCLSLMQLDFAAAFSHNQMLFILSPVLAAVFLNYFVRYVRFGKRSLSPFSTVVLYLCIALLVLFGIVRNLI